MGNMCAGIKAKGGSKNSEGKFAPMQEKKDIKSVNDVVANPSDFVVEHQDIAKFSEKYDMQKNILGKGAFGKVKLATLKANGEKRAVKIIDKLSLEDTERVRLKYEIDILKNLNHPNIVRLYEIFESKSSIFLVTELCDGCELFDEITKQQHFTEQEAAVVIKQVLQAIAYCHTQRVAHRDLKPENILIDANSNGQIKVIDFGTSHHYNSDNHEMHQMYGTPYYIAPEVLMGSYDEKCDLWSIGIILYILLCGNPPFNGSDDQIIKKVKQGSWEFRGMIWNSISDEAKDLVRQLINKNVDERPSAEQALQHPWILQKVKAKFDTNLAKKAVGQLGAFQNDSKLKQATLTFMASHLATRKQLKDLRISFNQFDENGDGLIQKDEFLRGYRKLYPNKSPDEVDERALEIFAQADQDGSGEVDFGEWCTATIKQTELLNEDNMRAAFNLFDKDGGGTIEASEIAAVLGHNVSTDDEVWKKVISEVDLNGDGQIDFEEFKTMLIKFANRDPEPEVEGPAQQ